MSTKKISHHAPAVVTGAGSGIGRAFALELHRRGGQVVCADINLSAAEETARTIRQGGGRAAAIACDVAKLEEVESLARECENYFGSSPRVVVNNAGVGLGGQRVEDISMDDWQWIMGVNLWGVIHGCRVFVPKLRERGEGAIINVASSASFGCAPMMGAYNTTKAGVVALSETLSAELAESGVRVTVLCPTFVKTDIVRNARIDGASGRRAQRMMNQTGISPELVAKTTLDATDRGKIHVLPQRDARVSWLMKRMSPAMFTRGMGLVARYMPRPSEGGG
jgi:NAD(P)-dependent dehydrogenase (short-subunit alcohol dehydrogenase family)